MKEAIPFPDHDFTPEEGRMYIQLNLLLARLMLSQKTVANIDEFIERVAPIVEMVVKGCLKLASEAEINAMREQVHQLAIRT